MCNYVGVYLFMILLVLCVHSFCSADICSFTVNPTRPELGAEVQFTASYQVNLNNVDVFCIIPDGKSLPPCGTSVPDDKSVVKATFVVADARSGKYTVSIASFLPGDKTYPIKKSTAVKSLKVTCSGTITDIITIV